MKVKNIIKRINNIILKVKNIITNKMYIMHIQNISIKFTINKNIQ